jgi:outer membrane protein
MDFSQETGAARYGLEHEGRVRTRRFLPPALLTLLVPLAALAQTPTPVPAQRPPLPADMPAARTPGTIPEPTGTVRPTPDAGVTAASRILRLEEAVQTALQQQPQLLEAKANALAAEGRVIQARSPLFPQLQGIASFNRAHNAGRIISATGANLVCVSTTCDSFDFGVNGNWLLWDFGQTWNSFKASEELAKSLGATSTATLLQVVLNARTSYFAARATRDLVRVAKETLDNQITHQDQVAGFVKVGTRPEIDLATARLNVANARVQLIQTQNADSIAKALLNQAMGVPGQTEYEVGDDELPPLDVEGQPIPTLFDLAESSRPEIFALEYARQAQEKLLSSAHGGWWPSLSAGGGFAWQGQKVDSLYNTWNFGLTLTWNFFQGGLTYGRVKEAEQNVQSATAAVSVERLQVRFDVEQAEATLLGNKESVVAAGDAVFNAKEQLRLAEGRYREGIGTIIELSDAQVSLTQASAQLVQAQYNLATARAKLLAALGRQE